MNNDNNNRDSELDQLLRPLSNAKANDLQMQKWQSAVTNQSKKSFLTPQTKWAFQLLAATLVGVVIGAVAFRSKSSDFVPQNSFVQNNSSDATYEHSYTKLD